VVADNNNEEILDDAIWNKMGRERTIKTVIASKTIEITWNWKRHLSLEKSVELHRQNPGTDKRGYDVVYYVNVTDVGLSPRADTYMFPTEEAAMKKYNSLGNFRKRDVISVY